ncbi:hypothetical protein BHE74_00033642, partial [Ensete ventricosum]
RRGKGWPATAKVPCKGAAGCGLDRLQERSATASPQLGPRGQAAKAVACRGDACGHGVRRQATCRQKLPPTRGGAHGVATRRHGADRKVISARPLVGMLSASKGSCHLHRGDGDVGAVRVREEG